MLQAIVHNKARGFLLEGREKPPREDVLTDCVFGGLRYFSPDQAALALHWMLPDIVPIVATNMEIAFWPRSGCEPDVIISYRVATSNHVIVIEAKWHGNPLTETQLDQQRQTFAAPNAQTTHLLLVEYKTEANMTIAEGAKEQAGYARRLMLWRDVAANLANRPKRSGTPELHRWLEDVVLVLKSVGQKAFDGWPVFDFEVIVSGVPVFLRSIQFIWPNQVCSSPPTPIFWKV